MKLFVVRHGKAEKISDRDYNRKLSEKGREQSFFLNDWLKKNQVMPFDVYFSNAKRTAETQILVCNELNIQEKVGSDQFYGCDFDTWFEALSNNEGNNPIILVGHNPAVSRLIEYLTGERFYCKTGSMTIIEFEIENWNEITSQSGKIVDELRMPNEL